MYLKYSYWYFKSVLSPQFCDDLIKHGNEQREHLGLTGGQLDQIKKKKIKRTSANAYLTDEQIKEMNLNPVNKLKKKEINDLKKRRNSSVAFLNDTWIFREIHPYINQANRSAGWNFDWDFSESCQFTKYKLNQFYDWHADSFLEPYNKPQIPNNHDKIRKISVTCSLSYPKDYEGGELEFQTRNDTDPTKTIKCTEILPRGSIVVFPSFVWHRVKPVTKGTRYSLVIWNLGYPFK
jgi:PKHD-type hydroxylase